MNAEKINIPRSIFREYDIRGQALLLSANDRLTLTPEIVEIIGQALGSRHEPGAHALVTGDNRVSTPALRRSVADGLKTAGLAVSLCEEEMPTGGASWLALEGEFAIVIQVTGSHTPPQYNGLKITERQKNGKPTADPYANPVALYGRQLATIYDDIVAGRVRYHRDGEIHEVRGLVARYQDALIMQAKSLLPAGRYRSGLRVVLDAGNGMGYYLKRVLEALDVEVHGLFLESDGRFPNHPADPLLTRVDAPYAQSGVRYACEEIRKLNGLQTQGPKWIAIITDGDGDRSGMVDELGRPVRPEVLGMLFYSNYLNENGAALRYLSTSDTQLHMALDVRGTSVFPELIKKYEGVRGQFIPAGYPIHRTFARGEICDLLRLRDAMASNGADFASIDRLLRSYVSAEISGHYFFNLTPRAPEVLVDDGLFSALMLLRILDNKMAAQDKNWNGSPLADLVRVFPSKHTSEEVRLDCPDDRKFEIVEAVKLHATEQFRDELLPVKPITVMHDTRTQPPDSGLVEVDGIRAQFKDASFFLVRASNTSPMLTFRFEASTRETLSRRYENVLTLLQPFKADIPAIQNLQDELGIAMQQL